MDNLHVSLSAGGSNMDPNSDSDLPPPSIYSTSIQSSLLRRIPNNYYLARRSFTNSTMSGIPGPGRVVGSVITSLGRRLERAVDRFSEERLGLGPDMAALRLVSALKDLHHHSYMNDVGDFPSRSAPPADELILACNGFCVHCGFPRIRDIIDDLPREVESAIVNMVKYLRPSQPLPNIALAAIYVRILAESGVFSNSLMHRLGLQDRVRTCWEQLMLDHAHHDGLFPDELTALRTALETFEQLISTNKGLTRSTERFLVKEARVDHASEVLNDLFSRTKDSTHWITKQIAYSQACTFLSYLLELGSFGKLTIAALLRLADSLRRWPEIPDHFVAHGAVVYERVAALSASRSARALRGHDDLVTSLAFAPNGAWLVSASKDRMVRTWDLDAPGSPLSAFAAGDRPVVMFPPGASSFISASIHDRVLVGVQSWNKQIDMLIPGPAITSEGYIYADTLGLVQHIAVSADGKQIINSFYDREELMLWDAGAQPQTTKLWGQQGRVTAMAFSPDGTQVASGSAIGTVRVWNTKTRHVTAIIDEYSRAVQLVAFSPDNQRLLSQTVDRFTEPTSHRRRLWKLSPRPVCQTVLWDTPRKSLDQEFHLVFSPDGNTIVGSQAQGLWDVAVWDTETGRKIAVLEAPLISLLSVYSLAISPDGLRVACGGSNTIVLWNIEEILAAVKYTSDVAKLI